MSETLWPRLSNISLSFDLISASNYEVWGLSDGAFRALMALVRYCAAGLVWTYSAPADGSLPNDDERLARVASVGLAQWKELRPELEPFFQIKKGRWHLDREWISIEDRPARAAIPTAIQSAVRNREGSVCSYCGDEGGPFEYDHIFPVSRGGKNDASNLTLACAPCNRSKGAKTLREWRS